MFIKKSDTPEVFNNFPNSTISIIIFMFFCIFNNM